MAADTEQAGTEQSVGVYVYGLVPENVEVAEEARGLGDEPGELEVVRHGEIGALVSEISLDRPLGTPDDLFKHQELLDDTAAEVPVLPLRFGAVMASREAVVEELLEPHHDEFLDALKQIEGQAEYVVKGRYAEQAVLGEVLEENPDAARLRDQIRGMDEQVARDARIQLGEVVQNAIAAKFEADTRTVLDAVGPVSTISVVREPTHDLDAAHVALLVENDRRKELEEAVTELADQWSGRVEFRLLGPLAPYDFVITTKAEG